MFDWLCVWTNILESIFHSISSNWNHYQGQYYLQNLIFISLSRFESVSLSMNPFNRASIWNSAFFSENISLIRMIDVRTNFSFKNNSHANFVVFICIAFYSTYIFGLKWLLIEILADVKTNYTENWVNIFHFFKLIFWMFDWKLPNWKPSTPPRTLVATINRNIHIPIYHKKCFFL